ncbi:MAG: cyclase family protein [Actinobacteria bacterium]|nr:cyclase family protein [Actinomycetota bacterium]
MAVPEVFAELAGRVNNWGRWGDDDEFGTLNLVDTVAVKRGAEAVQSGERISLALPLHADGVQTGLVPPGRQNPVHTVVQANHRPHDDPDSVASSDDRLELWLQAATHWDALSHVSYRGNHYNGIPTDAITMEEGATRLGIEKVEALVSRGVLLDVARALGSERLEPGYAITPDDLDAALELAGTQLEAGDIVLVRTGQMMLAHAGDRMGYLYPAPGLSMHCAPWFHERDVAAVATDTIGLEVYPSEIDDWSLPVHLLHLVEMGLLQGQNFDLEELAAQCTTDDRYTFLLSAPPEPVVGAFGAPVVPIAVR